jgi:hypothetical protein
MMTPLEVASQCTASMACLAAAMYSPRFQTRLTGVFTSIVFVTTWFSSQVALSFAILSACLMFSTWLSFTKRRQTPNQDWALFTTLMVIDLCMDHAFLPVEIAILCLYSCSDSPFRYCYCFWSMCSILVYVWPGLAFGWIPIGFSITALTERYIWRSVMANKKII